MSWLNIQTELDLAAPAAEVFDFVADHTNAPQWQKGLHEVRRITPGPIGVGTEHEFARRFAGMRILSRNRFIEYEAGHFVSFEIPSGMITGVASYRVESTGTNSSRLISTVDFDVADLARFATPLLALIFKRANEKDEAALKALLEHTGIEPRK